MPAYNPPFITPGSGAGSANSNGETIVGFDVSYGASDCVIVEPLAALGEIIFALNGDLVVQDKKCLPPQIIITPKVLVDNSEPITTPATPNPNEPVVEPTTPNPAEPTRPYTGLTYSEMYIDHAGSRYMAHKRVRAWTNLKDMAAKFITYSSVGSAAAMAKAASYSIPITGYPYCKATRESDGLFVSFYCEALEYAPGTSIYAAVGTIGSPLSYSTVEWKLPYFPIGVACDGTKFVVLTEGNRIYTSTDGRAWTLSGVFSPSLPYLFGSDIISYGLATNYGGVRLVWMPAAAVWVLQFYDASTIYITSDPNATTGWVKKPGAVNTIVAGTGEFIQYYQNGPLIDFNGAWYGIGPKVVSSSYSPNFYYGIWKTTDQGTTWTNVKLQEAYDMLNVTEANCALASICKFNSALYVYSTSEFSKVFKSTDGVTWTPYNVNTRIEVSNMACGTTHMLTSTYAADVGDGQPELLYSSDGYTFSPSTIS